MGKLGVSEECKVKNTGKRSGVTLAPKTTVRFPAPALGQFGERIVGGWGVPYAWQAVYPHPCS